VGWEISYLTIPVPTWLFKYTSRLVFKVNMSLLLCWERKLSLIGTEQKIDALRRVADIVGKDNDTGE